MPSSSTGGAAVRALTDIDARPLRISEVPPRIADWLAGRVLDRPTLVVDLEMVERAWRELARGLGGAQIHYAVKANPEPAVLARLAALGSGFDAASRTEIELCLAAGAGAARISFGNTVKRVSDIAWAHERGIDLYAADAEQEIEKIAAHAPGARVYVRLMVEGSEAEWPLGRKFGVPPAEAVELLLLARARGLRPVGVSFHVGSQTRRAEMWQGVLDQVAETWALARDRGLALELLNLGGGFPGFYGEAVDGAEAYGRQVMAEMRARLGSAATGGPAVVMAEPGRGIVADAGVIAAEVLLVSRRRTSDIARWVYLDIGLFSGLAETMGEAIRYRIETDADGGDTGPCVLAGPTCDSADVLYEKRPVQLPLALQAGDGVRILAAGAYTASYSSVGFNGFPPLDVVCI